MLFYLEESGQVGRGVGLVIFYFVSLVEIQGHVLGGRGRLVIEERGLGPWCFDRSFYLEL